MTVCDQVLSKAVQDAAVTARERLNYSVDFGEMCNAIIAALPHLKPAFSASTSYADGMRRAVEIVNFMAIRADDGATLADAYHAIRAEIPAGTLKAGQTGEMSSTEGIKTGSFPHQNRFGISEKSDVYDERNDAEPAKTVEDDKAFMERMTTALPPWGGTAVAPSDFTRLVSIGNRAASLSDKIEKIKALRDAARNAAKGSVGGTWSMYTAQVGAFDQVLSILEGDPT